MYETTLSSHMALTKTLHIKKLNKAFWMGYILKFRSPNLYTIIIVTKIKKSFFKG